jgi:hypothetical protein
MRNEEFYIGWMQKAPATIARFVQKYLLFLLLVIVSIGIALALNQKKFSAAQFEFGKTTAVKGIYSSLPVPHLLVADKGDYIFMPLVGYGKHGAEGIMLELEQEKKISLENRELTLKGTLLYGDGKVLMQVDKNEEPLVSVATSTSSLDPDRKELGHTTLKGEIVDPKCYFGVMKPGEGKPHKDCAIRCISGGIPPVLAITNEKGEKNYVLLLGNRGEKINSKVKDFVAVPSAVTGHLVQDHNWLIMMVDDMRSETASVTPGNDRGNKLVASCGPACCKDHF